MKHGGFSRATSHEVSGRRSDGCGESRAMRRASTGLAIACLLGMLEQSEAYGFVGSGVCPSSLALRSTASRRATISMLSSQGFGDKDDVLKSKSNLIKGVWKRLQGETKMNSVTPRTESTQPAEAAQRQDAPDGGVFSRSTTVPQGIYQTLHVHGELVAAVSAGDVAKAKEIVVKSNADPNFVGPTGWNALHWAVQFGQKDAVKYLIEEAGADCSVASFSRHTALHRACIQGDDGMVEMLLELGGADADQQVEGPNSNRDTPLHFAATFGHVPVVRVLKKHGADVMATDAKGQTARDLALSLCMYEVADELAEWEAELKQGRLITRIEERIRKAISSMEDDVKESGMMGEDWLTLAPSVRDDSPTSRVNWLADAPVIIDDGAETPDMGRHTWSDSGVM